MAKYDYGGGCPCGLYRECVPQCSNYSSNVPVKTVVETAPKFAISEASQQEMASGKATKDDWGKLRFDLIPPIPLSELAAIYTMGAAKYNDDNWLKGMNWRRVRAAIERHLNAFDRGEDVDPESGLPHVMHAAWGCFTLSQYMRTHRDWDDRPDWQTERVKKED